MDCASLSGGPAGDERVHRVDHGDLRGWTREMQDPVLGDSGERCASIRPNFHQRNIGFTVVHGVAPAAVALLVVDDPDLFGPRGGGDEASGDAVCHQVDEDANEIRALDLDFDCVVAVSVEDVSEQQSSAVGLDDDAETPVRPNDDSVL